MDKIVKREQIDPIPQGIQYIRAAVLSPKVSDDEISSYIALQQLVIGDKIEKIAELASQLEAHKQEIKNLKAVLCSKNNSLASLKAKVEQLESESRALGEENVLLSDECASSALEINSLSNQVKKSQQEFRKLDSELAGEPERRKNYLAAELERYKNNNPDYSQELSLANNTITELTNEKRHIQTIVDDQNSLISSLREQISTLEPMAKRESAEMFNTLSAMTKMKNDNERLSATIIDLNGQMTSVINDRENLRVEKNRIERLASLLAKTPVYQYTNLNEQFDLYLLFTGQSSYQEKKRLLKSQPKRSVKNND